MVRNKHIMARLNEVLAMLTEVKRGLRYMSKELDDLTAQVAQNTTVEESAVTLINGISARIDAAVAAALAGDLTALPALSASLKTSATDLSAAITANTPAA